MSDIIIFPKLKGNLMTQIKHAMKISDFDLAYDLFNEYEKHFELTEDEQLIKLDCLYQLESFLELREESSILLNQGHYAYDKIVPYFIESLLKLKQYKTVIELIDSLRSEDVNHQLLIRLMPFYDEANHQLNQRKDAHMKFIQTFKDNDIEKQLNFVIELIRTEDFRFTLSFVQLLEHGQLHPKVSSMMLEYLMLSGFTGEVKLTKLNVEMRIDVKQQQSMLSTAFMSEVSQSVLHYFEINSPDLLPAIQKTLIQHNTILYPIPFEKYFKCQIEDVADAYIILFEGIFNITSSNIEGDYTQNETIQAINMLEKFNLLNEL
ncbi:hypothetical protein [Macrococcoides caseolyticum]|uniref:hypothetical protein n=1 Tax=Macrococcoides caseolyticum TaxID=69966 RepID=UPI001F399384|nr:hypothetical protein [Macrococcus caseolyticus]MCE4956254.1 hypothetical protein [Macrococcus caseolyticus]